MGDGILCHLILLEKHYKNHSQFVSIQRLVEENELPEHGEIERPPEVLSKKKLPKDLIMDMVLARCISFDRGKEDS